jgi:transposase-like protein
MVNNQNLLMEDYFMAKSPHTPEFTAKVSQEYLDGFGSYKYLSTKYDIGNKTLRQWVAKYRLYGILAFATKSGNTSYSSDFKTMCVEAVLSGEGSVDDTVALKHNRDYRETASIYDVSYSQVYSWVKKYDAKGEEGLSDKRGCHKTDDEVDELDRLRRENLRLKRQPEEKDMVVELLKK